MISRRNFLKIVSLAAFLTGCSSANEYQYDDEPIPTVYDREYDYKQEAIDIADSIGSDTNWFIVLDADASRVTILYNAKDGWAEIHTWPASFGREGCRTFEGIGRVESKSEQFDFDDKDDSEDCRCFWFTSFYGGQGFHSVPYEVNAANDDGKILDGSLDGYKSHGCARMYTAHAKWIYDNIDIGTTVYSIPGFHTHDYSND